MYSVHRLLSQLPKGGPAILGQESPDKPHDKIASPRGAKASPGCSHPFSQPHDSGHCSYVDCLDEIIEHVANSPGNARAAAERIILGSYSALLVNPKDAESPL